MKSALHTALGDSFDCLPAAVRRFHDNDGILKTSGLAEARIAPGIVKALICRLIGFPRSGADQPVTVVFKIDAQGRDAWQRDFAGRRYRSWFTPGHKPGLVVEHQLPFTNTFRLTATPRALRFEVVRFAVLGIPVPKPLAARCVATETDVEGRLRFEIAIDLPLLGHLIRYAGELTAEVSS